MDIVLSSVPPHYHHLPNHSTQLGAFRRHGEPDAQSTVRGPTPAPNPNISQASVQPRFRWIDFKADFITIRVLNINNVEDTLLWGPIYVGDSDTQTFPTLQHIPNYLSRAQTRTSRGNTRAEEDQSPPLCSALPL